MVDWLEQNALANLEDFPLKAQYFADSFSWYVLILLLLLLLTYKLQRIGIVTAVLQGEYFT